ncbi:hypothetical protein ASE74_21860 [Pedobacter sp. Leaf216]|uniref:sigma factor-like helix-turn-helix DNA-binding protein n=1 Tax=Pedobacter sp. Leaf216 TaxID=1735684 RepID=UPI0006F1DF85|nr:sigma factor-like helix-turn-helix DNA-binding protein [Pedobacter sp. Leaf216]KQM72731.1 hypothetical protein ASE74_21860 [Pedobacter sp. Leaf216]
MFKAVLNIPPAEPKDIRWFYDRYAAMLLGYINGIVKDKQQSEDQLVKILTSFTQDFVAAEKSNQHIWLELRQYAQNRLNSAVLSDRQLIQKQSVSEPGLASLDDLQKIVFKAVYYHGKSISQLAISLNYGEEEIRNQLKLAIDKMRRARGN